MFIVATISINSYTEDKILEIIQNGADVLRYNFSHGTPQEMSQKISVAKQAIRKSGKDIKIMADLPGAKIRLGDFDVQRYEVKRGDKILFKSSKTSADPAKFIPVDYPNIGQVVKSGEVFTLADGEIGFKVDEIVDSLSFVAIALNDWHIPPMKAINIGHAIETLNHVTSQTLQHLEHLADIDPDIVAFSFVNDAEQVKFLKTKLLKAHPDFKGKILAKIETERGVRNLADIISHVDMVMVARGDLGLSSPLHKLGVLQKKIIQTCKDSHVPVIVATQILDSALDRFVPSRAEISDLTNLALEKVDGVMLAKETGISQTPGASVRLVRQIINEASTLLTES